MSEPRLIFALLADYAFAHPDGRLYMIGGAFNKLFAPGFPFTYPQLSLVMKIEFPREAASGELPLIVDVSDARGDSISAGEFTIQVPELPATQDELPELHAVFNAQQITFPNEGTYRFDMILGGSSIGTILLRLVHSPEPPIAG